MPAKRRKTTPPVATAPDPIAPASPPTTHEPDEFDRAIADRAAVPAPAPVTESPRDDAGRVYQPDPFPHLTVALRDGADAPRVRLFRSRRMNQVAVRFDEKPAEPHRQRLRDEGYKWRDAEGVWTRQLGDERASGQLAAERLVVELANAVRAEAGLAPVGRAVGG